MGKKLQENPLIIYNRNLSILEKYFHFIFWFFHFLFNFSISTFSLNSLYCAHSSRSHFSFTCRTFSLIMLNIQNSITSGQKSLNTVMTRHTFVTRTRSFAFHSKQVNMRIHKMPPTSTGRTIGKGKAEGVAGKIKKIEGKCRIHFVECVHKIMI